MKRLKQIIVIFPLFLFMSLLHAIDFSYFITPQAGISIGKIKEYLYINQNSDKLQSDLLWEEKPLINIGLQAGFSINNFQISTSFLYSLPFYCGNMFDSDYNNEYKTNLATYDLYNNSSLRCNLQGKYNINISALFTLKPLINIVYKYNSFNGTNGLAFKGDKSHSLTGYDVPFYDTNAKQVHVRDINFKQNYLIFYAGVGSSVTVSKFTLNCNFFIAPFSYINALDIHTSKDEDSYYYMYFYSFFGDYEIQADITYKINNLLSLYFSAEYEWSLKKRGRGSFPFNGYVNGNKNTSVNTNFGVKITK